MIELLLVAGCVLAWRRVRVALQRRSVARLEAAADTVLLAVDPAFAAELGILPPPPVHYDGPNLPMLTDAEAKRKGVRRALKHLDLIGSFVPGVGGLMAGLGASITDVHRLAMDLEYLQAGQAAQLRNQQLAEAQQVQQLGGLGLGPNLLARRRRSQRMIS